MIRECFAKNLKTFSQKVFARVGGFLTYLKNSFCRILNCYTHFQKPQCMTKSVYMDEKQMNCKCVCKYLLRQLFLTFRYKRKKNERKQNKRISKTIITKFKRRKIFVKGIMMYGKLICLF